MALAIGLVVWVITGAVSIALGGAFMSGVVFVVGGLLAALTAGLVSALMK